MDNYGNNYQNTGANDNPKKLPLTEVGKHEIRGENCAEMKNSIDSVNRMNFGTEPIRIVTRRRSKNTALIVIVAVLSVLLAVLIVAGVLIKNDIIQIGEKKQTKTGTVSTETETPVEKEEPEEQPEENPDPVEMYVANVKNAIYLRNTPDEGDNIIKTIPVRTKVKFLENANAIFAKIEHNGQEGYVKREYLSQTCPEPEVQHENTTVVKTMIVANVPNSIYLRSGASESSSAITTIPVGEEVGYIERANSVFSKIKYNGSIGYAKTKYLEDYHTDASRGNMVVCNVPNSIYLRSGASESASVVTTIPVGEVVEFIGNANGTFYRIYWNGHSGYAKAKYLRFI